MKMALFTKLVLQAKSNYLKIEISFSFMSHSLEQEMNFKMKAFLKKAKKGSLMNIRQYLLCFFHYWAAMQANFIKVK